MAYVVSDSATVYTRHERTYITITRCKLENGRTARAQYIIIKPWDMYLITSAACYI